MLSKWEQLFLLIMTLSIMGHVVMQPLMLDVAGRDGWLSVILALPAGIIFTYAIYRLRMQFPDKDFPAIAQALCGKPLGLVLRSVLIGYFMFLSALSAAALADMVNIAFLPETPIWALVVWGILISLYAVHKGVKTIALTAGILTFSAMLTGHTITLLDSSEKEWSEILPVLEFGWTPVLLGTVIICSIWMELLLLLLVPWQQGERRIYRFWAAGVLLNGLMMLSTFTGAVMIFGLGQADNMNYPALEIVRILSLGFIDRFDIYGLFQMTLGCYIRISLYARLAYDQCGSAMLGKKWARRILFFVFVITITGFALYLAQNHIRLMQTASIYIYSLVLYPLPFVLLILSYFRSKKSGEIS